MTGLVIFAGIIAFVAWLCVKTAEIQSAARNKTRREKDGEGEREHRR